MLTPVPDVKSYTRGAAQVIRKNECLFGDGGQRAGSGGGQSIQTIQIAGCGRATDAHVSNNTRPISLKQKPINSRRPI